jgi:hypothetical protein
VSADTLIHVTGPPALVTLSVWGVSAAAAVPLTAGSAWWRRAVRRVPGVRFVRVLGTAAGGAMGPADADPRHWAVLVAWDDAEAAAAFDGTRLARAFDTRAYERLTVRMRPLSSRGRWGGEDPFGDGPAEGGRGRRRAWTGASWAGGGPGPPDAEGEQGDGPVAAVTRARLAPGRMRRFYRAARPVAADLARADGLLLALGIGEAPLGLQGTVSLWRSAADLTAFAYRGAPHADVVRRTPVERWYREELFARLAVLEVTGRYRGRPVADA